MQTPCHFSPPVMIEFRSIRCQWLFLDQSIGEFSIVYKKMGALLWLRVVMMATKSSNQSERSKNCLDQSESRI